MKPIPEIEILEPYPAVYIQAIDAIVISDLHLGYEGVMAEYYGVFLPKTQLRKELEALTKITSFKKASTIVITGDLKHEFSETTYAEFREVTQLFEFLKNRFKRIIVIKGNHDNYLYYVAKKHNVEIYDALLLNNFLFIHGDVIPKQRYVEEADIIFMGHEHPAIALFDQVGVKEKIKAFLIGNLKDKRIVVMPAFSPIAHGSEINLIPVEDMLSPILKKLVDVDKIEIIGIDEDTGCLEFGELGKLRVMLNQ